jgi:hypothetical protein
MSWIDEGARTSDLGLNKFDFPSRAFRFSASQRPSGNPRCQG